MSSTGRCPARWRCREEALQIMRVEVRKQMMAGMAGHHVR